MNYTIKEIAHQLKTARIRKNISQRALSDKIGMPQSHISKIEAGQVDLKFSSLIELARVLGFEVTLIPCEFIPAVQSITQQSNNATEQIASEAIKKLNRIHTLSNKLANQHKDINELLRISILSEQLKNFPKIEKRIDELDKVYIQLYQFPSDIGNVAYAKKIYRDLLKIRNNPNRNIDTSNIVQGQRPAYRLDENAENDYD